MIIFSAWLRGRAIVQYRSDLPRALAREYGKSDYYLPAQVEGTIDRHALSKKYAGYAVAMFCTEGSFDSYRENATIETDYHETRTIIGRVIFDGISNFKQTDLTTKPSVADGPNDSVEGVGTSGNGGGDGGGGGGD